MEEHLGEYNCPCTTIMIEVATLGKRLITFSGAPIANVIFNWEVFCFIKIMEHLLGIVLALNFSFPCLIDIVGKVS